ncbi:heterokaryon incompatibility protein-domain-containing protein [Geopyxis carbonaria]|nr:heterokaryon incompatibility protein-domain-containing protein [Geopyxis carbonaria]
MTMMLPQPSLCEICAQIDLLDLLSRKPQNGTFYPLGSFPALQHRQALCQLCNFLASSIAQAHPSLLTPANARLTKVALCAHLPDYRPAHAVRERLTLTIELTTPMHRHGAGKKVYLHIDAAEVRWVRGAMADYGHSRMLERVNVDRLRGWLKACIVNDEPRDLTGPTAPRRMYGTERPVAMRLLDLKTLQLVATLIAAPTYEYAALSYVRGPGPPAEGATTTKATLHTLEKVRSFDLTAFPKTIRDAVHLLRELDIKYLWVDVCCVVQDDVRDTALQTAYQADIWQNAALVIGVLDGADSEAGIPGVNATPRLRAQGEVTVGGVTLYTAVATAEEAARSVLSGRGWTWQEARLARRYVLLGAKQFVYGCRVGCPVELMEADVVKTVHDPRGMPAAATAIVLDEFTDYRAEIEPYSSLALTNSTDALDAIAGMLSRIHTSHQTSDVDNLDTGGFFFGLPIRHFALALLWQPVTPNTAPRRPSFPSWSWAAWECPIKHVYAHATAAPEADFSVLYELPVLPGNKRDVRQVSLVDACRREIYGNRQSGELVLETMLVRGAAVTFEVSTAEFEESDPSVVDYKLFNEIVREQREGVLALLARETVTRVRGIGDVLPKGQEAAVGDRMVIFLITAFEEHGGSMRVGVGKMSEERWEGLRPKMGLLQFRS